MKKAFYLLGTLFFALKLAGVAACILGKILCHYEEKENKTRYQEAGKVRQPIGFAVERLES